MCAVMRMQILYNLVGNSAKFTTDGSITVMLKPMPCNDPGKEFVQLSVRDSGCGISKEKQRDMFVPFGQVHALPIVMHFIMFGLRMHASQDQVLARCIH